ncbi:PREDICTED: uncharacterized protein LOC108369397 [Rhagoletis zephyria]|uniref:uncharacterized protein LOC108369397 n=1 Tax=Rhagoletis zephyria TaxID=28612 RepID=UPI0008117666|nr:PREDICTED: uncharacterized protein LOC108369397 [Rhagoletis zephyria]
MATRMRPEVFDCLFNTLKEQLEKKSLRASIPAECRLFLTLIYLAHGSIRQYLSLRLCSNRMAVVWNTLSPFYLSKPNAAEWQRIAEDFKNIWNLPTCVAAIDGKHIAITCPAHSRSNFYNYKGTYSIVLLGVCDANYTFTAVDVGAYGSQSDGGILTNSVFGQMLFNQQLDLLTQRALPNISTTFPYYFIGDAAFTLKSHLMKSF